MDSYEKLRPWTDIERCDCERVTSIMLVDRLGDNPIHCAECRGELDPERLQLTMRDTDDIAGWFAAARALYRLWLDSGEYEDYAKRCLQDPKGQVNVVGMELAERLSKTWPTRLWFLQDAEDDPITHCPVCGHELDTAVEWGSSCCPPCRLQIG